MFSNMCFIGNDIISLTDNYNRKSFSNPKYLQKVLTDKEFLMLNCFSTSDYLPFLFWTCKESAYKIAMKSGLESGFVPHHFEVNKLISHTVDKTICFSGTVSSLENIYYFHSQVFSDYISTISCNKEKYLPFIENQIGSANYLEINKTIIEQLKSKLVSYFKKNGRLFKINKNDKGIPYIYSNFNIAMPDISISHDAKYFSIALLFSAE